MKCYYHPNVDAVAICKNCNKGLCSECSIDVTNGIACRDRCEEQVKEINEIISRNKTAYQKTAKAYSRNAVIYGLLAVVFILFGIALESSKGTGLLLIVAGVVFLLGAIFSFSTSKRFKKTN